MALPLGRFHKIHAGGFMHTLAAAAAAAIIIITMYFVMCVVTSEAWMQNGLCRAAWVPNPDSRGTR